MRFDVVKRFHYYDEELTCRHFGLDYTFRLLPHVDFHVGDYRQEYAASIAAAGSVDLLFLDGAEDAHEARRPRSTNSSCLTCAAARRCSCTTD